MKSILILLFSVLFVFGCLPQDGFPQDIYNEVERIKNLEIADVDPASLPDG